jgi:prepilin-type N-terminal cleavage/methylation domain-containing protein
VHHERLPGDPVKTATQEEKGMRSETRASEHGFSLIELMVAMLVTLIVSGAIYGLLASGQGAFRREPELADRQQNIRVAMDLIQKDLENGGAGMTSFTQVFTNNLNAVGPVRPDGTLTDYLELRGNDGECPTLNTCKDAGVNLGTQQALPACFGLPALVYVSNTDPNDDPAGPLQGIHFAFSRGGGLGCGNGHANFCAGGGGCSPLNPGGGFCGGGAACDQIMKIQMARYQISIDAQGVPNLWRTPLGQANPDGSLQPPGAVPDANSPPWQMVARGIEDLQVQYLNGNGAWADIPGVVDGSLAYPANYNSIVREVRVTLTARNTGIGNLQGASQPGAAATRFVRGSLTSIVAPRAALTALTKVAAPDATLWR